MGQEEVSGTREQGRLDGPDRHIETLQAEIADLRRQLVAAGASADLDAATADHALQAEQQRLRAFADASPHAMLAVDAGGTIIDCNAVAPRAMGCVGRDDLVGRVLSAFVSDADLPHLHAALRAVMDSGGLREFTGAFRHADGSEYIGALRGTPLPGDDGQPGGVVVVIRDLTEPRRSRRALTLAQSALDSLATPAYWFAADGAITDVNAAACRSLGYTRDELLGMHIRALERDGDVDAFPAEFARLQSSSGSTAYTAHHVRKDGTTFPVEARASTIEHDGETSGFVVAIDVSDREQALEAARESEMRYRSLFDDSPTSLWLEDFSEVKRYADDLKASGITDLRAHVAEHPEVVREFAKRVHIIRVNRATLALYGADSVEQFMKGLDTVLGSGTNETFAREVVELLAGTTAFKQDAVNYTLDGRRMDVHVSSFIAPGCEETLARVVVAVVDITDRMEAERALRRSEANARAILDASTASVMLLDREGTILDCNRVLEERFGLPPNGALGAFIWDLLPPDIAAVRRAVMEDVFRTGQPRRIEDERDGIWVTTSGHPVFDEAGNVVNIAVHAENITERRRAEEALRRSQALLETILAAAPIGIGLVTERVVGWTNARLGQMLGYSAEELDGMPALRLYESEHEYERVGRVKYGAMRAAGVGTVETRFRRKDGSAFDVLLSSAPVDADDLSAGLVFTVLDITDLKQAEREQEQLRKERALVMDGLSELVLYIDQELRLRWVNNAVARTTGILAEQLVGRRCHDVWFGRETPCDDCPVIEAMQSGNPIRAEVTHADGATYLVNATPVLDANSQVIGAVQTMLDVTDMKAAEVALAESEARYRALVENSPDIIMRFDREGRHLYASPSVRILAGTGPEQLLGKTHREFGLPEDLCTFWEQQLHSVFETGLPTETDIEVTPDLRAFSSTTIQCLNWRLFPEFDGEGNVISALSILRDTTAHRVLEEKLLQASKMEAIGRLAGGVAHDFNNVLTAISGYVEFAIDKTGPAHEIAADLEQVRRAAERAASLTRQLLAFGRKQVMASRVLDLNSVVREVESMLRRMIGEDIQIVTELQEPLWRVMADPVQMDQILMNLAINARDAMPAGGRITVSTANVVLDDERMLALADIEPGRYIRLTLADTGIGMDAETAEHIFEPFFTTKGVGEGTGLGLATVYGIVKQSGGHIECESKVGVGTSIHVYLPCHGEPEAAAGPPGQAADAASTGTETILLVEDDETVRDFVATALRRRGYTVLVADHPEHAIRLAAESEGSLSLLITDVVMPQMGGRELVERLSVTQPSLPVLFMSGYAADLIESEQMLGPGVPLLHKPFTLDTLSQRVRELLDGAERHTR